MQEAKLSKGAVRPYIHCLFEKIVQADITLKQKLDEQVQRRADNSAVYLLLKVHCRNATSWSSKNRKQYTKVLKGISDMIDSSESAREINASQRVSCSARRLLLNPSSLCTGG